MNNGNLTWWIRLEMVDSDEGFRTGAETSGGVKVSGGHEVFGDDEVFNDDETVGNGELLSRGEVLGGDKIFGRHQNFRTTARTAVGGGAHGRR